MKIERHVTELQVATLAQLVGDVGRNVLRPAICGVEGNDAHRVAELSLEHAHDHRLKVGSVGIGFSISAARGTEVVQDYVDVLALVLGNDRWCQSEIPHATLHATAHWNSIGRNRSSAAVEFLAAGCC